MNYHGTVLDLTLPNAKKGNWPKQLPCRGDFLDEEVAVTAARVEQGKSLFFLPLTFSDHSEWAGGSGTYGILCLGILPCGTKAAVLVSGVWPQLEVRVPEGKRPAAFKEQLLEDMKGAGLRGLRYKDADGNGCIELRRHYPLKYHQKEKVWYVKLEFNTHISRAMALKYLKGEGYETAVDDKGQYYRVAARQFRYSTCGWNRLRHYERLDNDTIATADVQVCLTLDIKHFTAANLDLSLPENRRFAQDRSLLMCWDLETYNRKNTSRAPMPEDLHLPEAAALARRRLREMRAEDLQGLIMMNCCSFGWYGDAQPRLNVCVTTLPVPPQDYCLVVRVADQRQLLEVYATLIGRMRPEMVAGFNDGRYDWPFLKHRVEAYDLGSEFRQAVTPVPVSDDDSKARWTAGFITKEYKLEADQKVNLTHYMAPGLVCMDVRAIFQKLYPGTEESSLNFYLKKNMLKLKEDMEIIYMNRIFRIMRQLQAGKVTSYDEMRQRVEGWKEQGIQRPFADLPLEASTGRKNPLYGASVDPSTYGIERLTVDEVLAHLRDISLVVRYCCTDAESCHRLLQTRKVVNDKREAGELSFTDLYDCCSRADGMRVRSVVIAEAIKPEWDIAVSNWTGDQGKTEDKYPGAYVLHPKKGLYRDTVAVKDTRRRDQKRSAAESTPDEDYDPAGAVGPVKLPKLEQAEVSLIPPATAALLGCNDTSDQMDRPCTGLDFSSLYPSEVMNDDCSPEKVIVDEEEARRLTTPDADGALPLDRWGHPYRLREVQFYYGKKGAPESSKQLIHAWLVQYTPIARVDGKEVDAHTLSREQLEGKPPIVRYEGFGIYAHVLRMLFDKRAEFKKQMETYGGPMKFLDECFLKGTPLKRLAEMPCAAQWRALHDCLAAEHAKRAKEFAEQPKPYYKDRLAEVKHLQAYFSGICPVAQLDGEVRAPTIPALHAELVYNEGYYNRKQNIMKVFMNTFYGETGNTQSAFFMVEVAGSITTGGQWALKTVRGFVESLGYRAMYGDTDSLYLCCPESCFAAVDAAYAAGTITKKQYWEQMIEITMEDLTQLKDRVNHHLFLLTRKRFLKMAYEEVLWPVLFVGKKKYAGIQHLGIPNLAACDPGMSPEDFARHRSLFIRGLELKKRGSSQFLKIICAEVLQRAMCLTNEASLLDIVLATLREIPARQWDNRVFVKTAKYKLPGRGSDGELKPGNRVVLPFMERMTRLQQEHPELGIGPSELGDRFEYINAKRQPWHYSESGRKIKIGAHERLEYVSSIGRADYEELVGPVEPDIQHYITGEVIGQLARFVSYHPRFLEAAACSGRALPDAAAVNLEDENEADDFYKRLDDIAYHSAKRELTAYYTSNFGQEWLDDSKNIRAAYKTAARDLYESWEMRYGDQNSAMFLLERAIQEKSVHLQPVIFKTVEEGAKTQAKRLGVSPYPGVRVYLSAFQAHRVYISSGALQKRRRAARTRLEQGQARLRALLPQLERICLQEKDLLHKFLDRTDEEPEEVDGTAGPTLALLHDCYVEICAAYIALFTSERFEQDIKNGRAETVGASVIPTGVREQAAQDRRTRNSDFHAWLARNAEKSPVY